MALNTFGNKTDSQEPKFQELDFRGLSQRIRQVLQSKPDAPARHVITFTDLQPNDLSSYDDVEKLVEAGAQDPISTDRRRTREHVQGSWLEYGMTASDRD